MSLLKPEIGKDPEAGGSILTFSFFCCADRIPKISELTISTSGLQPQICFSHSHLAMAASGSSSQVPCEKYDVFISFRGPDVRSGFLSHLERELDRKGIDVYVDHRLKKGDEISSALVKAIEGSMIALVIFSKDYASSRWCLEELVNIMKCKEAGQQIVIPLFYDVDPSNVRHQKGTYAEAFTLHEKTFMDKVEIWRSVLKKSANLAGHQAMIHQNFMEDVLKKLEDNSPIVPNSQLIGLHQNFRIVESLMEIMSQEVRLVGIWGMGGIGKTTLARAIFDKFLSEFASCCFLENVREKSIKVDGLNSLRDELLFKLLGQKDHKNIALRRLQRKKVLIVLDDVDNSKQLENLAGQQCLLLGSGSRIIVTSRDKHILRSGGILDKYIHEVNALNFEESLQLFCRRAFNQSHPNMGYQELSETTVAIAQGIPLALEVLGSHFHCRDTACWKNKALIKLDQYGHIVMHDLIREMAEQIVRGENMRHPERRSRLKDANEIYDVLKSNMGTDEIEGIILDMTQIKYVQVEADIFVKMKNLRFLKIFSSTLRSYSRTTKIDILSDLDSFPNKLRYLHWDHYPLKTLPSGSYFENLVELHMQQSNVKRLWDGKQDLGNLKTINLSYSEQLIELPDFSMARKLENVDLQCCKSLRSVHPSILFLPSITKMNVLHCSKLESFEGENLESLSYLNAIGCSFKKFCLSSNKLRNMYVHSTKVQMLHLPIGRCTELIELSISDGMFGSISIDELCCLTNLRLFSLTDSKQVIDIKQLHSLFDAWCNLRGLILNGCSYLSEIPDNIKALTWLERLQLGDSAVETLPACVNHLSNLKYIYMRGCRRLKSILGLPPSLIELDASECTLLETVSSDSLVRNKCVFNFCNCEKLDKRSLRFIQELIISSMTSTSGCHKSYDDAISCYPGSRVPEWMEFKPMTEAYNATEFTCNLERSQNLLICCVTLPHLFAEELEKVPFYFGFSYGGNNKFDNSHSFEFLGPLNRDHVLLWPMRRSSDDARIGNDTKISCEFFLELEYWDDEDKESPLATLKFLHIIKQKDLSLIHFLSYFHSPKMPCGQISCFLISSCGVEDQAWTRTKNVLSYSAEYRFFVGWLGEIGRLSASTKKLEKELNNSIKFDNEQSHAKPRETEALV
ncbi:hypothetical protein K1719_015940 [Acacia pycnantha]|nr:hypothetical protein K1719_015940 [Acacia pycnantha]